MDSLRTKEDYGAHGAEIGTDRGKHREVEEERFSFFKSSKFRPVSLTLPRAQPLGLRRNCCSLEVVEKKQCHLELP